MKHKFAIGIAAAALGTTAFAPAAMAYEIHDADGNVAAVPDNAPVVEENEIDPGFFLPASDVNGVLRPAPAKPATPTAPAKQDPKKQAELTGMQLDNAKKGVETAKDIVDTLNGLGKLFGVNGDK